MLNKIQHALLLTLEVIILTLLAIVAIAWTLLRYGGKGLHRLRTAIAEAFPR